MSVLKLGLKQIDSLVLMQVLEQSPELLGRKFDASNGLCIRSVILPAMSDSSDIYIRGSRTDYDHEICYYEFSTEDRATETVKRIKQAVKELNAKYAKKEEPETAAVIEFEVVE